MISEPSNRDLNKTLAFLARRVGSLEKKNKVLEDLVETLQENQHSFRPIIQGIFEGIERNGLDHDKILKHLGLE